MAGIGFELRKLFHKEGLINNIRAYAYSSLTTVGPMILCMFLIIGLQRLMNKNGSSYLDWELYIVTVSYCFIFSIVFTSGVSMVLTRYVADMLYQRHYNKLMSSYYGALIVMIPLCSIVSIVFLSGVQADTSYKLAAYLFFMLLIITWIQGVYLSALKDYIRIARGFIFGGVLALVVGELMLAVFDVQPVLGALIGLDSGFLLIVLLSSIHFEKKFPKGDDKAYFEYLQYFKKYRTLFFAGCFVYSGVYLHNFVYWLSDHGETIANQFRVYMFYDVPVFYAFLSVMPTLVTFVVSVETSFYEKFRIYYLNVLEGGTIQDIAAAKKQMQKVLTREISFLMEIQVLFTILSIALGIKFLPKIGFTMEQLDLFIILALAYFLFIILFVFTHILMYFDDRKGVIWTGAIFFMLNIIGTYIMMKIGLDGLGIFIAAFISLIIVISRLLYVLRNIDYFTFCSQPIYQENTKKGKKSKSKLSVFFSTLVLLFVVVLSGCSSLELEIEKVNQEEIVNRASMPDSIDTQLIDDKRLYERDDDTSLKTLYITVLPYTEDETAFDWYALNRQVDKALGKKLDVIVQEGLSDDQGPRAGMFGYSAAKVNGTIAVRGNSTWKAPQKSFKIKLTDEAGLYMDQQSLNLNKHLYDQSRMRNKLSFDLMETIPDMTSLRTQFFHLYVKDLSNGNKDATYEDYGLFTHIEQYNKQFLRSHLLDPNGYLYKAISFEYYRYEDQLKDINDANYNKEVFDSILEIKGREDHAKLLGMLDDLNNFAIPIDEVVAEHFDENNFLTWTAMNLLMDNVDTLSQNFYLYSPLNSEKWYLLPWDYDGGYSRSSVRYTYHMGLSMHWGNVLHSRYFRIEANVKKLEEKLLELSANYINEETIDEQISTYRDVVEPFMYRQPDRNYLPSTINSFERDLQKLKETPKKGLELFYEDLPKPKPFFLDQVQQTEDNLLFSWIKSFDLQDDAISYKLTIAKNPDMLEVLHASPDLVANNYSVDLLPPGKYFWKVVATDSEGNIQYPIDYIKLDDTLYYFGVREFEVN